MLTKALVSFIFDQYDSKLKLFSSMYQLSSSHPVIWGLTIQSLLPRSLLPPAILTLVKSQPEIGQIERSKSKVHFIYNLLAALMR